MGFGGISVWQLVIVLVIVVLLFGTKKLRSLGGDLGDAIKNFKQSVREGEDESAADEDSSISHNDDGAQDKTTKKDKQSS